MRMMTASRFHHQLVLASLLAVAALRCAACLVEVGPQEGIPAAAPAAQPTGVLEQFHFLHAHNEARAAVGVDPLRWSQTLGWAARWRARQQKLKNGCGVESPVAGWSPPVGANQDCEAYPVTPAAAVGWWVKEGKYYSYENNSCTAGHECGQYTQVVWRDTKAVGCAQALCGRGWATTLTLTIFGMLGEIN